MSLLLPSPFGIGATAEKIAIGTNLNAASSRMFYPKNYLKAYCKIRPKPSAWFCF